MIEEYARSKYKASDLYKKMSSTVHQDFDCEKVNYGEMCDSMVIYLYEGWKIVFVTADNINMNMQTQNENTFQREHNLAIAKDLVRNLRERKAVGWIGNVKAIIPLLVRPKRLIQ